MLKIKEVNFENLNENILDGVSLVFAYAEWCGPCKLMLPFLENIEKETLYNIIKLDVDKNIEAIETLGIKGVPTVLYYKDHKIVDLVKGYRTSEEIMEKIKEIENGGDL